LALNKLPEVIEVKYISDNWIDHPELEKLLVRYTENEWGKWAEKIKRYTRQIYYTINFTRFVYCLKTRALLMSYFLDMDF